MISFRSARKLSSYLVRAKLYPLERTVGLAQCKGKRGVKLVTMLKRQKLLLVQPWVRLLK